MAAKPKVTENPDLPSSRDNPATIPMSLGNMRSRAYAGVKTDGVKTRGNGAATKGTKARGPMA